MSSGFLHIRDSRTEKDYDIPIAHNAIRANEFKKIKAPGQGSDPFDKVDSGILLLDPGFSNTAIMESHITFVDGEKGVLLYRGYNVNDLYRNCQSEDTAFLLIWGHLPSLVEKLRLRKDLATASRFVPPVVLQVVQSFPRNSPPMPMLMAGLSAYISSYPNSIPAVKGGNIYNGNMPAVDKAIIRTISAYATILGMVHCHRTSQPFQTADPHGSYLSNLLLMMGCVEQSTGKPNPKHVALLERLWVVGADHELTNSTSAFLHTASTQADPISCLVAAIASCYGPLHFGASEGAYRTMEKVGSPKNVPALIAEVKQGKTRLAGIGHRMYKITDPRLVPCKEILQQLKDNEGLEDPLMAVAKEIDRLASTEEYFTKRRLFVNADLYWPFIYTALGFPPDIMLPIFIASRMSGFMAHWREAMNQPARLWRPLQSFTPEESAHDSKL